MEKFGEGCLTWIIIFVLCCVFSLLLCYPIMLLWNWLMPVFGLPTLTFWQMYGLEILCDILFKSNIHYNPK